MKAAWTHTSTHPEFTRILQIPRELHGNTAWDLTSRNGRVLNMVSGSLRGNYK